MEKQTTENDYIYEGFAFENGDLDDLIFSPMTDVKQQSEK